MGCVIMERDLCYGCVSACTEEVGNKPDLSLKTCLSNNIWIFRNSVFSMKKAAPEEKKRRKFTAVKMTIKVEYVFVLFFSFPLAYLLWKYRNNAPESMITMQRHQHKHVLDDDDGDGDDGGSRK